MAINGRLLVGNELASLPEDCQALLSGDAKLGTLELFHDRTASFDSFSHMLHAPRKAPTKNQAKAILVRECKCDLAPLNLAIEKCTDACAVYLERNEFRAEGLEVILKGLLRRTNLKVLAIKRNFVGDKGAKEVAKLIDSWNNPVLHTLYLGYCNISKSGVEELCKSISTSPSAASVTNLDLTANFIKQDGAAAVGGLLLHHKHLKVLKMGGNMLQDEGAIAVFNPLARNQSLSELCLSYNHITEKGIKVLADSLKTNTVLSSLNIDNNSADEPGAMHLTQALRINTTLTSLCLSCNKLGDRGAEHVAGMLRWATQLQTLTLADNAIGNAGAQYVSVQLAHKTHLELLDLDKNPIEDAGKEALVGAMKQRQSSGGGKGKVPGVLRVGNHAFGVLHKPKVEEALHPAQAAEEAASEVAAPTPEQDLPRSDSADRPRRKASLDTGNVKLKIEKKTQAPRPEGPLGELFKAWSASAPGQKGSKLAKSMDFKEFTEMLKALDVIPKRLSRLQVQQLFRLANRAGAVSDGDNQELDWLEFEFAMRKVAEKLRVPLEALIRDPKAKAPPPARSPPTKSLNSSRAPSTEPGTRRAAPSRNAPELNAELDVVFGFFAASEGQSKKRAASMDSREFVALLEHLLLMPDKLSKTFAMECFTKGKKQSKDQSELDWNGFEWAMKRIAKQIGIPYEEIHRNGPAQSRSNSREDIVQ